MKRTKPIKTIILTIIAIGIFGLIFKNFSNSKNQPSPDSTKPTIKIGATLPLSGNLSYIGDSSQKTLDMAIKKWNSKNTKYNYELILEDDAFDAKRVAAITNKFINIDKVNAILSVFSIGANVVSPITERNQVIHMTCAYGSQPADGLYNLNNITQYEPQTQLMLDTLKKKNIKTIALLISNNIGSTQQAETLEKKILENGSIKIVAKEIFNIGTKDFGMLIQKIINKETPEIFYVDGITPEASLVAKYLKQITGDIKLTTINDFIETPDREPFEGLWFVESASGTPAFIKEYEEKYNDTLFICGANSYDNLDLLIWAFENTPPRPNETVPNNDDIIAKLLTVKNHYGAIGEFSIDKDGIFQSSPEVKTIKNNKPVTINE